MKWMKVTMERTNERPRRAISKDKQDKNLNLVDVYDIAADIGKVQFIVFFLSSFEA